MSNRKIDIAIIGAGIAGITCARELSKYSSIINLTVLEASDRIGGRIKMVKADDGTILELGAHYIHGTKGNAIFDFAIEKGILQHGLKEESELNNGERKGVVIDGHIDKSESNVIECFHKDVVSACSEHKINEAIVLGNLYIEEIKKQMDEGLSNKEISIYRNRGNYVMEYFNLKLKKHLHDRCLHDALKSVFAFWVNDEKLSDGCAFLNNVDLKGVLKYTDLAGEPFFIVSDHCANGYVDIINAISEDIKIDCIKLNCEVYKIENVIVNGVSKIKVDCTNGNTFYADATVLTVSVAVLQQFIKSNVFSLELPETKLSAIKNYSLGNVTKIYFKFIKPVQDISCFKFYPLDFLDSSILKSDDYVLTYLTRVGNSDWWLYWTFWDDKIDLNSSNIAEHLDKVLSYLSDMYPKFPNLKVDIKTIIASDWINNKFYRGTYSYPKPGADEHGIAKLAEPVSYGEANLLFAGEATSEEFYSTTHGAYLSGIREAENIKSIYKLP